MGLFSKKNITKDKEKIEPKKVDRKDLNTKKQPAKQQAKDKKKSNKQELKRFDCVDGVLLKPLVTEKVSNLGMYNQYAFEVKTKTNKIQIKKAIETYYHVKPLKVNIINIRGKNVRWGRTQGMTRGKKKAIVTLRQGDKIEVYEGV